MGKVVRLRNSRPRTYTKPEQVIEELSDMIMASGKTYKQIGTACRLSPTTVARVATRQTIWPRPGTFFPLLHYFGAKISIDLG